MPGVQRIVADLKRYGFDLLLVLIVIEGLFEVTRGEAVLAPSTPSWFGAVVVVAVALPLFARRGLPFAAPLLVWILGAGLSFVDGRLAVATFSIYLTGAISSYLLGNLPDPARARAGLAIVLACAAVVVYNNPARVTSDFVTIPATFAIAWLAGLVLRARAELAEQAEQRARVAEAERESSARIAVAEERSRIARELHDIVAHAVSVMVLQVGAVRHRLPDAQGENKKALRAVEDAGRSALNEMRRLLAAMPDDAGDPDLYPQPGLEQLTSLVEEVRRTGLNVRLHRWGEPMVLPRGIDLSAFRIVQEALTNCLKHANAQRVDVTVSYAPDDLQINVVDDGMGSTPNDGLGRGIMGIQERVKVYGGDVVVSTGPDGGFQLDVRLPIGDYSR